jgi:PASTA domain
VADDPHQPEEPVPGADRPAPGDRPGPDQPRPAGQPPVAEPTTGTAQDPWQGQAETVLHPVAGDQTIRLPLAPPGDQQPPGTRPPVGPGGTAMVPRVPGGGPDEQGGRWAARAGVPRGDAEEEDWVPAEESGGAWWLPLVFGIGGLILLALVGGGLWLAFQHSGNAPAPAVSASPTPSAAPSSLPPSVPPSPSPVPSLSPSPALVDLPDLRGVAVGDAQQVLATLGLNSTVRTQPDASRQPGIVIGTDPQPGQVPAGSTVTLTVAAAPATSAPPSPTLPASPTPTPSAG